MVANWRFFWLWSILTNLSHRTYGLIYYGEVLSNNCPMHTMFPSILWTLSLSKCLYLGGIQQGFEVKYKTPKTFVMVRLDYALKLTSSSSIVNTIWKRSIWLLQEILLYIYTHTRAHIHLTSYIICTWTMISTLQMTIIIDSQLLPEWAILCIFLVSILNYKSSHIPLKYVWLHKYSIKARTPYLELLTTYKSNMTPKLFLACVIPSVYIGWY